MIHRILYKHFFATHRDSPNMTIHFCWPRILTSKKRGINVSIEVDGLISKKGFIDYGDRDFFKSLARAKSPTDMFSLLERHKTS